MGQAAAQSIAMPMPAEAVPVQSLQRLLAGYRDGRLRVRALATALIERRAAVDRPEVWISAPGTAELLAAADRLDARLAAEGPALLDRLPLFGLPFAVKDNLDVAGVPTTAACPAFAYTPARSAPAVQRLLDAGALYVGKTNLDQFATGLVGTRSPYGAVRNALRPEFVSGGSSSGSAVAVALGLASFALGTDTAGSGRVPAAFNGLVGLKPSLGLVSPRGVVPACRSLDCVSVFAHSVADAWTVLGLIAGFDDEEPRSRRLSLLAPRLRSVRMAVAERASLQFFGDREAEAAYDATLAAVATDAEAGWHWAETDIAALTEAARLLYAGPWIAERRLAVGDRLHTAPETLDPAVRAVLEATPAQSAEAAFAAQYQLAAYRAQAGQLFERFDALLLPTAPCHPRIADVAAEPLARNSELGTYTNFVNLLDLAAIAIPGRPRGDGLPFGITLIGPAGSDQRLAVLAAQLRARLGDEPPEAAGQVAGEPLPFAEPLIEVAVVGAHLQGQPLNWQLIECGARCVALTRTAERYRLYALAGTVPAKPGLVRCAEGGAAIEVEVWAMPQRQFGRLMAQVGAPLGIGSIELCDGRSVKGFICEPIGLDGARDITDHGGWRRYLASATPA